MKVEVEFGVKNWQGGLWPNKAASFATYIESSNTLLVEGAKINLKEVEPRYAVTLTASYTDVFGFYRQFSKQINL